MQTIWKGAVSFGLVHVPVKMYSATRDNDIPMRLMHRTHKEPIRYIRTCPNCEEEVEWKDIIRGYEYEKGQFVTFDQDELEELSAESSREIRIAEFVALEDIDPVYYDRTYYLTPDETGEHAYRLLSEALRVTNKVGIANVTIRQKSRLAAVRVIDGALALATMHYKDEVIEAAELPEPPAQGRAERRELDLATALIGQLTGNFDPGKYKDEYRERLLQAIEDKKDGQPIEAPAPERVTNVLDLMTALQASLQQLHPPGPKDKGSAGAVKDKNRPQRGTKRTGA